jgi:predicted amidohydrolase
MTLSVIGGQLDIAWKDPPRNCARVASLLEGASVPSGSLIVLPEMFATGFDISSPPPADGTARAVEEFLASCARKHDAWVLGGVATRGRDGRGRNEAVVFDAGGSERARYAKMYPFSFAGEAEHFAAGDRPVTFTWNGATAAPAICYDLRFPELFRELAARAAELFVVIANWPQPREDHWVTLLRARAIENQAYVVGVNRCGADPHHPYSGRSLIVDPHGVVQADAGGAESVLRGDLDLEDLRAYRKRFPALADRR